MVVVSKQIKPTKWVSSLVMDVSPILRQMGFDFHHDSRYNTSMEIKKEVR